MDRRLQEAFREFNAQPSEESVKKLFKIHLQTGRPFELSLFYRIPRRWSGWFNLSEYRIENFTYTSRPLSTIFQQMRLASVNALTREREFYGYPINELLIQPQEYLDPSVAAQFLISNKIHQHVKEKLKECIRWFLAPTQILVYIKTEKYPFILRFGINFDINNQFESLPLNFCPICHRQAFLVEVDEFGFHLDCFSDDYVIEEEHTIEREDTFGPGSAWDYFNNYSIEALATQPDSDIEKLSAPEYSIELPLD